MRHIVLGAGALALAATAAPLAAQDGRLAARLDARTLGLVAPVIDSARVTGIPTEPLVQKALEGASKRAPGDRIAFAVRRLAGQLGTAREALGGTASSAELVAGASALQAGVQPGFLASLRAERADTGALVVPLGVMAELIARGVNADTAAAAVTALTQVGATDGQLVALRHDVERDIGVGAPPTTALLARGAGFSGFDQSFVSPTDLSRTGSPNTSRTAPRRRP